jgi:hypothetical protein
VTVRLLNIGADTIKGFNLAYSINSGMPVIQHFNEKVIPFGDSLTVTFATNADLSRYGIYDLIAYGFNNNDDYLFNDTLRVTIENTRIDEPLTVKPNPFTDKLEIVINSETEATARISLFSPAGKKLIEFEQAIMAGLNEFRIENLRLAPSVYYLKIESQFWKKTIPVIKLKP